MVSCEKVFLSTPQSPLLLVCKFSLLLRAVAIKHANMSFAEFICEKCLCKAISSSCSCVREDLSCPGNCALTRQVDDTLKVTATYKTHSAKVARIDIFHHISYFQIPHKYLYLLFPDVKLITLFISFSWVHQMIWCSCLCYKGSHTQQCGEKSYNFILFLTHVILKTFLPWFRKPSRVTQHNIFNLM